MIQNPTDIPITPRIEPGAGQPITLSALDAASKGKAGVVEHEFKADSPYAFKVTGTNAQGAAIWTSQSHNVTGGEDPYIRTFIVSTSSWDHRNPAAEADSLFDKIYQLNDYAFFSAVDSSIRTFQKKHYGSIGIWDEKKKELVIGYSAAFLKNSVEGDPDFDESGVERNFVFNESGAAKLQGTFVGAKVKGEFSGAELVSFDLALLGITRRSHPKGYAEVLASLSNDVRDKIYKEVRDGKKLVYLDKVAYAKSYRLSTSKVKRASAATAADLTFVAADASYARETSGKSLVSASDFVIGINVTVIDAGPPITLEKDKVTAPPPTLPSSFSSLLSIEEFTDTLKTASPEYKVLSWLDKSDRVKGRPPMILDRNANGSVTVTPLKAATAISDELKAALRKVDWSKVM